jgi:restriction system protein
MKGLALQRTLEAQQNIELLSKLLAHTLSVDDAVDWNALKKTDSFDVKKPSAPYIYPEPSFVLPGEPNRDDSSYIPIFSFLDKIIPSRKKKIIDGVSTRFSEDHQEWKAAVERVKLQESEARVRWELDANKQQSDYALAVIEWEKGFEEFNKRQARENEAIDAKRSAYEARELQAIIEYCDLVLSLSVYPDYFPQEFEIDYDKSAETLIVDYVMPPPEAMPNIKSVKYNSSLDTLEEQLISDLQLAKIYDDVLYQIVLRTVHELFEADTVGALSAIVFNGIVTSLDRSSGKKVTACVLSLRATKTEFNEINLGLVDPRACFKSLKGVGSAKLSGLAPVPPIMQMRRDDGRFVSAYEVANTLDESVNLASMDWEDFEHLIRDVFEKEFSSTGGVRVTQASRDGGVDAVAFDPDPIRGGKIVIQAKRYTNTVGVGAVRDLYGTVVNEGATKGVLVTTSDYGPDSYTFANGKPIVLLNGANLLHMLERHGHRARIDIHEAKKLAAK